MFGRDLECRVSKGASWSSWWSWWSWSITIHTLGVDTHYLGFMMNLGRGNMMYRTMMFHLPRRPRSREGGAEPYFG